jgi:hypothetical protein
MQLEIDRLAQLEGRSTRNDQEIAQNLIKYQSGPQIAGLLSESLLGYLLLVRE